MAADDSFLEQAFHLIEEAENLTTIYKYGDALQKLNEALSLFDKSIIPQEEKQQAIDLISARISDLEALIASQAAHPEKSTQAHPNQETATNTPGLRPPPVFGAERDQMVKLGLKALANSEELINQGHLYRAYKSISYAYSHLTQAQYDPIKVENIGKIGQFLANNLMTMGYTQEMLAPYDSYTPSFLTAQQPDYIPQPTDKFGQPGAAGPQNVEPYTPTFLTTDQVGYSAAPKGDQRGKPPQEPYVPTFTQTQQPDFADQSKSRVPHHLKHLKSTEEYVPTFAQTDQADFIPQSKRRQATSTEGGAVMPTFAKAGQAEGKAGDALAAQVDLSELRQMFSLIEEGKPIPRDLIQADEENRKEAGIAASSGSTQGTGQFDSPAGDYLPPGTLINPKYYELIDRTVLEKWGINLAKIKGEQFETILTEKQHEIEIHAQQILDDFEKTQEAQNARRQGIFEYIDLVHPFEKSYDYESAIKTVYKAIGKLNKLLGWADQALVLYAWLLILKEKQRVNFRIGENGTDFDLGRINKEFVQIMNDALNTSKEVAISFIGDDFNQELTAEQIYKAKLEEQAKLQDRVFDLLDTGNLKLLNEEFSEAISYYNRAVLTLNSLDWSDLRTSIENLIINISDLKQLFDISLVREFSPTELQTLSMMAQATQQGETVAQSNQEIKSLMLRQYKIREDRITELDKHRQAQSDHKYRALSLISQAEGLLLSDLYDDSISLYEEAIDILIGTGWEAQIPRIIDRLVKIRKIREEFISNEQDTYDQMFRRNVERRTFEDSIQHSVDQQLLEFEMEGHSPQEIQEKTEALELQKQKIFHQLEEVEKLAENGHLAEAVLAIKPVKEKLEMQEWDVHLTFIYDFVTIVQDQELAKDVAKKEKEDQRVEIEEYKQKIESYLDDQSQLISATQDKKSKLLHEFQTYMNAERATSNDAMALMEQAEGHLRKKEFQAAIALYQEADLYFAKLGWNVNIQQQVQRTRQLEYEFKQFFVEYQQEEERKKAVEARRQAQLEHKISRERSALSDIHKMLDSINSPQPDSRPPPNPATPPITPQTGPHPRPKPEKKPKPRADDELDELQKMIRDAAKSDE